MYLKSCRRNHEHALEDLGEIPEVERVVGLGGSGQQLPGDGVVHGVGGADNLRSQFVTFQVGALIQPSMDNGGEDPT